MAAENLASKLRLGNYEVLFELATGGMATVYVARHLGAAGFERLVVVKRVHRHLLGNREFTEMFIDEARVASHVRHPNVVPVIDVVESDGEIFLVMEYVESAALSALWKGARKQQRVLPPEIVVRIVADMLSGLHAAHEAVDLRGNRLDIVHRDVSPQNVIVGLDGSSRLIDFGVAKAAHRITETRSGSVKGKYGYMAPEQTRAARLDRRSDLFSAGIVLYEALTGKRLFTGENEFEIMRKIQDMQIVPPSAIVSTIPPALDAVCVKALSRPVNERFQTATEFLEALEKAYFPAPIRDVASWVDGLCGDQLAKRRSALQNVQSAEVVAPSVASIAHEYAAARSISRPGRSGSYNPPGLPERDADGYAMPRPSRGQLPIDEDINIAPERGTESKITATRDAPRPSWVDGAGRNWALRVATLLTFMITFGAAVLLLSESARSKVYANQSTPPALPSVVDTSQPPPVEQPTMTATPPPPAPTANDPVELSVDADSQIQNIEAPRATMRKAPDIFGSHATLFLAPFSGPVPIEAVLVNGKKESVIAEPLGSTHLRLVAPPPPAPAPPPRPPVVRSAPRVTPRPQPPPQPAPKPELHSNPYSL